MKKLLLLALLLSYGLIAQADDKTDHAEHQPVAADSSMDQDGEHCEHEDKRRHALDFDKSDKKKCDSKKHHEKCDTKKHHEKCDTEKSHDKHGDQHEHDKDHPHHHDSGAQ
ncbi:MAG: hypothetical protein ACOY3V_04895 [Pseudomonadota bacterium]